jgi:hypothetical protein
MRIITDLKHHCSELFTDSGRLIKAADNVFLDVNDATIIIEVTTTPTFFGGAILKKQMCEC